MNSPRRRLSLLIAAAALACAGAPRAAEPEAIATAPAATSTADQIDAYLRTSPALALPKDGPAGVTTGEEPRQAHGFVDLAVGSSGYRSAYVQSDLPVGKTGTLSIGVGETRFKGRVGGYGGYGGYGSPYGGGFAPSDRQSLALGLSLGGDAVPDARCRQSGQERSDPRQDPPFEGDRPLACQTAGARTSPQ
jgi:hypothetical protein